MKLRDTIWVLFISMVPLIELRGSIPIGSVLGLPFYTNYFMAVIGNLVPVPFILIFIPKILEIMAKFKIFRPIVEWLHKKAHKNRTKIEKTQKSEIKNTESTDKAIVADLNTGNGISTKNSDIITKSMPRGAFIGLLLFVLLPLPGTGAWTGSLVAALFEFPKLKSFLAIALGVIGCGVIMCLASYGVLGFLSFLV